MKEVANLYADDAHGGVLILHGGLYRHPNGQLGTLSDLLAADRRDPDPHNLPLSDVLWSDPSDQPGMRHNKIRGLGVYFGPDVTNLFHEQNGTSFVVRAHEGPDARKKRPHLVNKMMNGFGVDHLDAATGEPSLLTLFSAPDYPQGALHQENTAAVLDIQFEPIPLLEAISLPQKALYNSSYLSSVRNSFASTFSGGGELKACELCTCGRFVEHMWRTDQCRDCPHFIADHKTATQRAREAALKEYGLQNRSSYSSIEAMTEEVWDEFKKKGDGHVNDDDDQEDDQEEEELIPCAVFSKCCPFAGVRAVGTIYQFDAVEHPEVAIYIKN